jgi:hypothetical protein
MPSSLAAAPRLPEEANAEKKPKSAGLMPLVVLKPIVKPLDY